MTLSEFSNQFDLQYNNLSTNQAPGMTEYEKSVFLTKAQEEIVLSLYNGRNSSGESFESSEEFRRHLSDLVKEATLSPVSCNNSTGMGNTSKFFKLPSSPKVWFITYEAVTISNDGECNDGATLDVVPVTQDDFHRVKRNPFRGANGRRALRLDLANDIVEIVCKYDISGYYIRYVKELNPIILEDLPDDLTIKGESGATECELNEALHQMILDRAVALAFQSSGFSIK